MNAERLVELLRKIRGDLDVAQVETRLQQIDTTLQQVITTPSTVSFQTQLVQSIQDLREALSSEILTAMGPVFIESVREIHLNRLLPVEILQQIDHIFQRSQLTPAVAQQELREFMNYVTTSRNTINQVLSGLESFGFHEYAIPPNRAEIGVLIPRAAVHNRLDEFGKEAEVINRFLMAINEAVNGEVDEITIQSVSSSEFVIYVLVASLVAEKFAGALSKMVDCFRNILEVRLLSEQLKEKGLSEKQLSGTQDFADAEMKKTVEDTVKKIIDESGLPQARKNEVRTMLRKAFLDVAKRLDAGYSFDVNASPEAESSEDATERKSAASIDALRKSLEFVKLGGEPILQLPPGDDPEDIPTV